MMLGRSELMVVLFLKDISFSRCEGMWFGSVALCISSVTKSCVTPSQFIPIGDMSGREALA